MSTLTVKSIAAPVGYDLQMPAGHILQVLSATKTDTFTTTSTSFVDVTGWLPPNLAVETVCVASIKQSNKLFLLSSQLPKHE